MDSKRWQQIEELGLAALEREESERLPFVAEACGKDEELRSEVESWLGSEREARSEGFIESPALEVAAKSLAEDWARGNSFRELDFSAFNKNDFRYRILEKLDSGGMGVVYKAEDTKLNRLVALKFLSPVSPDFDSGNNILPGVKYDRSTLERALREARASSALDHPNICTVYEVDQYEGHPFIVMQFLTGRTLKHEINSKPLSLERILDVGIQIAGALNAAHTAGIIHRDIKSANIFVTDFGEAKILDFGLAKLASQGSIAEVLPLQPVDDVPAASLSESANSRSGRFLGTTFYMSPEQILGKELDARTDLFSFGIVLYEMATGQLPFRGETAAAVSESILKETPVLPAALNSELPGELGWIIEKALHKDRDQRYQTAAELRDDLKHLKLDSAEHTVYAPHVRKRWPLALAAVTVLSLAASLVGYFHFRARPTPGALMEQGTLVLADFNNTTGEPIFDGTLKQALRAQLEQSPLLNVLSDQKTRQELSYMGRPLDARLTGDVAREVCLRSGSKAYVGGTISSLGNHYAVLLQALNCQTGDTIGNEEAEAESREKVLRALDEAATKLRSRLGESLATIQKYGTPVEEATTPSLDALHAYSLGVKVGNSEGLSRAIPFLKRAIELDPNFALAYAVLGISYILTSSDPGLGTAALTKAYELRERVSQQEKFYIESHYYQFVTGQAEKAIEVNRLWQQTFPRDSRTYDNLGLLYQNLGQYELAVSQGLQALRTGIYHGEIYGQLACAYINLNQFDKAETVLSEAKVRKMGYLYFPGIRYQLAFFRGDEGEMEKQVAMTTGKPAIESWLLAFQADTEAYGGHLVKAREFTGRAIKSARHDGMEEGALAYAAVGALRETQFGNHAEALRLINTSLAHNYGQEVEIFRGLTYAQAGDERKALTVVRDLNQRFPLDTLINEYWLPTIRAAVELRRNNPTQAIEDLEQTKRYELASPQTVTTQLLYPVYLRGEAYLAAGFPDKALAEFQKILDRPGLAGNYLLGSLAHLSLARAYAMEAGISKAPLVAKLNSNESADGINSRADALAKSRAAYQDFFTIWKDADPDIPLLKQAQMEYHKLQ